MLTIENVLPNKIIEQQWSNQKDENKTAFYLNHLSHFFQLQWAYDVLCMKDGSLFSPT